MTSTVLKEFLWVHRNRRKKKKKEKNYINDSTIQKFFFLPQISTIDKQTFQSFQMCFTNPSYVHTTRTYWCRYSNNIYSNQLNPKDSHLKIYMYMLTKCNEYIRGNVEIYTYIFISLFKSVFNSFPMQHRLGTFFTILF